MQFLLPFIILSSAFTAVVAANAGDGTYYYTGLGACGIVNNDSEFVVAVSHELYDTFPGATPNPNNNPICGKQIKANYQGKSVTVTVADRCAGCAGRYDLDFSPAAFQQLADLAVGRIQVQWDFIGEGSKRREGLERRVPPQVRREIYGSGAIQESN